MPRVNRRLVRTVYWAGICWHVAYWHVAYFNRTVHVYRALIGRPTNMRNLKKVTNWAGIRWHVACPATTWRVKYITSIRDHRNKICKKVEQNFTFCDRTFYNKSKTCRFQADVPCWTCGNSKSKLWTRGNSKQATLNFELVFSASS